MPGGMRPRSWSKPYKETPVSKSLLSILAVSAIIIGTASVASAQVTTTATSSWTTDQGTVFRDYSTTKKYKPFSDPAFHAEIGVALPGTVELYPLPETIEIPNRENYSYSIVNGQPVVVERNSRKILHSWH
jgi:hypothetical protein